MANQIKLLALDISTKTGWAFLLNKDKPQLVKYGTIKNDQKIHDFGNYPECYLLAANKMACSLVAIIKELQPDIIVIEETNQAHARYAQKILEFIHCELLHALFFEKIHSKIYYISSSTWRQTLELTLSKDDKANNKKCKEARESGVDKSTLGVKGRINKKHLAIRHVNEYFNLELKMKNNDVADAICLGLAYFNKAAVCDGH
jgi:Holliday junction resolvasome RuvABC endonuclease subunit